MKNCLRYINDGTVYRSLTHHKTECIIPFKHVEFNFDNNKLVKSLVIGNEYITDGNEAIIVRCFNCLNLEYIFISGSKKIQKIIDCRNSGIKKIETGDGSIHSVICNKTQTRLVLKNVEFNILTIQY